MKEKASGGTAAALESLPDVTERYAEYEALVSRAVEVFGDKLQATRWLSTSSADFEGKTPLQVLIDKGSEPLFLTLGRIEHGVFF